MKPALLVVDMQNQFFVEGSPGLAALHSAVEGINEAIALFRRLRAPVIVILDIGEPERVPGQPSFDLHSGIQAAPGDPRVHKLHSNAFWRTELDELLRREGVDTVVVSGWSAAHCVLGTYRGALERDYRAMLLRGGVAGPAADHLRLVESISEVVSPGALAALLG
jgi:nicotinamidase-related amidase